MDSSGEKMAGVVIAAASALMSLLTFGMAVLSLKLSAKHGEITTLQTEIDQMERRIAILEDKLEAAEDERDRLLRENIELTRRLARLGD